MNRISDITAKPFVKWVGGKGQLISQIEELLPHSLYEEKDVTYVEPFVGGGAMLFFMLQKFPNITHAVINDINPDLVTCYRTVKDRPKELINKLFYLQQKYEALAEEALRKQYFLEIRRLYNMKEVDEVTNSAYFIFLNKTCFNGLYRVNKSGGFNVPFGRYKTPKICDPETIMADHRLLQKVSILCGDFAQTIEYTREGYNFFYFDPPYRPVSNTSSFESYTKEGFGDEGQRRLKAYCDLLDSRGFHYALSNSDGRAQDSTNTFFDELYQSYHIHRVYASRNINANGSGRGKISEILVTNYEVFRKQPTLFHDQYISI